jgi:DNA-binding NarL/FixJ family response regulator
MSPVDSLLSITERKVIALLAIGLCDKEIAARMNLEVATIKVHNKRIFKKLGTKGRVNATLIYHGIKEIP